jgi:hypothetical protein
VSKGSRINVDFANFWSGRWESNPRPKLGKSGSQGSRSKRRDEDRYSRSSACQTLRVYGRSSEQTASAFSFGTILCGFTAPACITGEKRSILQPSENLKEFQVATCESIPFFDSFPILPTAIRVAARPLDPRAMRGARARSWRRWQRQTRTKN